MKFGKPLVVGKVTKVGDKGAANAFVSSVASKAFNRLELTSRIDS